MFGLFERDVCKMRCRSLVFLLFAGLLCLPGRADTIDNVVIYYVVNGTLYGSAPQNINENDGDPLSLGIISYFCCNNDFTGVTTSGFPTSVQIYGTVDNDGDFAISQPQTFIW